MRWPGTIQPSRFLSHTGHILPGVRQVVAEPQPGVGLSWTFTVPAGVEWWVVSGYSGLVTSATAGTRYMGLYLVVDGTQVWIDTAANAIPASTHAYLTFRSDVGVVGQSANITRAALGLPSSPLPQGSTLSMFVDNEQGGDRLDSAQMYIEEYYFTDAQLSEDARLRAELEHDIAEYEYQQAEQTQGGA